MKRPLLLAILLSGIVPHLRAQQPRRGSIEVEVPSRDTRLRGVTWLGIDPSGNVVVKHSGPEPIRRFDSHGNALRPIEVGKAGEVVTIGWLKQLLWVWKRGAPAAELFELSGKSAGSFDLPGALLLPSGEPGPFAGGMTGPVPIGLSPDGSAVVQALVTAGRPAPVDWKQPQSVRSGWFHARSDGVVDRVVAWAVPTTECTIRVPGAQAAAPFCNRSRVLMSNDGSRAAVVSASLSGSDSGTVVVVVVRAAGDTIYSRRYPAPLKTVSPADADSAAEALVQSVAPIGSTELVRAIHAYRPVFYPPASSAFFATDGSLWIGAHSSGPSREWTVLSPDGVKPSRVLLPSDLTLWDVRGTSAWATRPTKDGGTALVKLKL